MKRFFALLILPLVFSLNIGIAFAKSLIPGGESIGIVMHYDGVLVTGDYAFLVDGQNVNPNRESFQVGDLIKTADGDPISCNDDLISHIRQVIPSRTTILVEIERDGQRMEKNLQIYYDKSEDSFKTGLYIKDNITGIGTITFYDPETLTYGALGHPMTDPEISDTKMLEISAGESFDAYILSIDKSNDGSPGQKIARIEKTRRLGDIALNSTYGVYGHYESLYKENLSPYETASADEVKKGPAQILTVLDDHQVNAYDIEITELKKQSSQDIKGITFKITDQELLSKTNGVIQGMSGSPIIQNNHIIGAVTHVCIDDVDYGYGLYIEWMLEENKKMIS